MKTASKVYWAWIITLLVLGGCGKDSKKSEVEPPANEDTELAEGTETGEEKDKDKDKEGEETTEGGGTEETGGEETGEEELVFEPFFFDYEVFVRGSQSEWGPSEDYKMTFNTKSGCYEVTATFPAGKTEFKIASGDEKWELVNVGGVTDESGNAIEADNTVTVGTVFNLNARVLNPGEEPNFIGAPGNLFLTLDAAQELSVQVCRAAEATLDELTLLIK